MKRLNRIGRPSRAAGLLIAFLATHVSPIESVPQAADYARQVQPILHRHCASCHGDKAPQGGLTVLTRAGLLKGGKGGPAIVPGSSQASLLIQHVTGEKQPIMPVGADPLKPDQVATLKAWIDEGASWSADATVAVKWQPPLAPRRPAVPETDSRIRNPIDRFIAAYSKRRSITLPQVVVDASFARRVYLDLWGLLPNPQQLETFLKDKRPNKREALVDQLLGDAKLYSQHWISFWNDLLRNDEGVIYHGDRQSISQWLLKALENNLPYDQFVSALLNPAKPGDPAGFLIGVNWRGDVSASQSPPMQAAQNSAQVLMGVNLKCASCHDSFINQWKLRESYGLASFFSDKELELVRCDVKLGETAQLRFLYPELGSIESGAPLAVRREAVARLMTLPENGRFSRTLVNRYWKKLLGRGLVEPVDDMDTEPWDTDLLDWLASDFAASGYDLRHLLRQIVTSEAYQLPAVHLATSKDKEFSFKGPLPRRLTAEQFVDGVSSVTGEWRVFQTERSEPGVYSRDWRLKSSSLTRALGRPIRDQVFTSRNEEASTLQALELVNGEDLAYLLRRGARKILNQLDPTPQNLFDSGAFGKEKVAIDINIQGVQELWLLTEDAGSYDRNLVIAGWADARLIGPEGEMKLSALAAKQPVKPGKLVIEGSEFAESLITPLRSELVFKLKGRSYSRLQAVVGVDESCLRSDISPRVRFFVFAEKPDPRQLVRVTGEPPVPMSRQNFTAESLVRYVYRYALSRDPTERERQIAGELLVTSGSTEKMSADGLEDLFWALFLLPEFQFIY